MALCKTNALPFYHIPRPQDPIIKDPKTQNTGDWHCGSVEATLPYSMKLEFDSLHCKITALKCWFSGPSLCGFESGSLGERLKNLFLSFFVCLLVTPGNA